MIENITERFHQWQSGNGSSSLTPMEQKAFLSFSTQGIPTVKHEEWKYTRISPLFNKDFAFASGMKPAALDKKDMEAFRLPCDTEANELVFVNGIFNPSLSTIVSKSLVLLPLSEAAEGDYKNLVAKYLGHSGHYVKDGIHALNTAFVQEGMFLCIPKGVELAHPVYFYHLTDARHNSILAQPRSLVYVGENAGVQLAETYATIGRAESLTNQVMEVVLEKDARVSYYKIQNDTALANQVSTTNFRQVGKSFLHAVTVSLNGGIVRNNLSLSLEAERGEAHLYGLYFLKGQTHVDNHTVVDHIMPNCESNELYKGIIDDSASAVFNGKIFVQPDAQKTNAFQSNKNILMSETASVNTKPQLEIFADDVKCSHGCTIGQLNEEGLFYLQSRGIQEKTARALLVRSFVMDILEYIQPMALRAYVDGLIADRLDLIES
jgi:Fe-S cluster assembly protein SufD